MTTRAEAIDARHGKIFHHVSANNADGSPLRCRANGKCKTWKRSPDRFRLPVKHGLYNYFYIDETNADEWLTNS